MGELSDRGLHEIFVSQFGPPGTPGFERARHNFIVSEAAYAVASFILQVSDCGGCVAGVRHEGAARGCGRRCRLDVGWHMRSTEGTGLLLRTGWSTECHIIAVWC